MTEPPPMVPSAEERARRARSNFDINRIGSDTAGEIDMAYRDGFAAGVQAVLGSLREPGDDTLRRLAALHSIISTNNPDGRRAGEQLPQAAWPDQPAGWRARCEAEVSSILLALAAIENEML